MNKIRIKRQNGFLLMFFVSCMLILSAHAAYALPTLKITEGGGGLLTIADGSSLDSNTNPGVVKYNGSLGAFNILITIGATKPVYGGPTAPRMDNFSLEVSNYSPGLLVIEFSETGYGPFNGYFNTQVGGNTKGTFSFNTYVDSNNQLFGATTNIGSLGPFSNTNLNPPASTTSGILGLSNPFSMTSIASVIHDGAGDRTTFNLSLQSVKVPELETVYSLGICLFGLVGIQWRRDRV